MTTEMGVISANNTTTPGWGLNIGSGERFVDIYQKFDNIFSKTPKVIVTLSRLDASVGTDVRIAVTARDIDSNSFNLRILTWSDTLIYGVDASWIATDDY